MGLFGSLVNVVTGTVKVALTPVAVVKDVVIDGDPELNTTHDNLESAMDDFDDAADELLD